MLLGAGIYANVICPRTGPIQEVLFASLAVISIPRPRLVLHGKKSDVRIGFMPPGIFSLQLSDELQPTTSLLSTDGKTAGRTEDRRLSTPIPP